MGLCTFCSKVVVIVYASCVTTMSAAPSDPNSGFTMFSESYIHLMDKLAINEESVKHFSENQLEDMHTIVKLQGQFTDTQNNVSVFQNSSFMHANEIVLLLNETNNLQMELANLNGNYSLIQSRVENIEYDIRKVKSSFVPVYNEIAALKVVSKESVTCQNKTALLKNEVQDLKELIIELQEKEQAREADLLYLYNKVTSSEHSMSSIQLNIDNLTRLLNVTSTSNEQIMSEMENNVFKEILKLNETNNANIQNIMMTIGELEQKTIILESNWSKELHQVSTECKRGISKLEKDLQHESKIRESLINASRQSLHDFTVKTSFLERNLTQSIDKLSETVEQNILKVQTSLERLNIVHNVSFSNAANRFQRLEEESAELKVNLTHLHDTLTRSLENITMIETGLENEIDTLKKRFNTSLNGLHSDINTIKTPGSSLNSSLHTLSSVNSLNTENVSKMIQEFNSNLQALQRQQNISISNTTTKFNDLQRDTRMLSQNQTHAMNQMSMLFKEDLSRIAVELEDKVRQLSALHNTSVENCELRMNNFNGQLQIFEQDVFKAVQNTIKQHDNNISNVEKELITMVKTIEISQNSSMEALLKGFVELEGKSKFIEGNLSTAISSIAIQCLNNISSVTSGISDEVSRVVLTQNTTTERISTELSNLYLKLSRLTGNLLETTNQITTIKESVVLTACSNTATLTGGSVILFENIKNSLGIANLSKFELTGKFTGDKPGLYLIAVQVMSYSKGAEYLIVKNASELSRVQVTPYHDGDAHNYHTGTGVAVVELVPNDEVWIKVHNAVSSMIVFGAESCLTVTKIK